MKITPELLRARLCAAVSAALLAAVLLAGARRAALDEGPAPVPSPAPGLSVAAFAADRNAVRSGEISALLAITSDESASDGVRETARLRLMDLYERMEAEAVVAEVLAARGYESPVVTVHGNSVNVVVRTDSLTKEEAGVILELVVRETGVDGGNIKLIPIN